MGTLLGILGFFATGQILSVVIGKHETFTIIITGIIVGFILATPAYMIANVITRIEKLEKK